MQNPDQKQSTSTNTSHSIDYLGIKALRSRHPTIRKLKRQQQGHSAHGNKVWRSSFVLMDYLTTYPPTTSSKILDVGCGWGLTAIYCTKQFDAEVTGVDADPHVFPYLQAHAGLNEVHIKQMVKKFEELDVETLADYDLIIGGDICFWDQLNDVLFDLFQRAKEAGVEQAIIADPQRQPFVDLCARLDDDFSHEVWDWELPEPTPANGDILVIDFNKS